MTATVLERITTVNDLLREIETGGDGRLPPTNLRKTGGGDGNGKKPNRGRKSGKFRDGKPRKSSPIHQINYDPHWKDFDFVPETSEEEYLEESEIGKGKLYTVNLAIVQEKLLGKLFDLKKEEETTDTKDIRSRTAAIVKEIAELQQKLAEACKQQMQNKLAETQAEVVTASLDARSAGLRAVERSVAYDNQQTFANQRIERHLTQARRAVEQVQTYRSTLSLERGNGGTYRYNAAGVGESGFPADRINALLDSFGLDARFDDRFGQGGFGT